MTIEDDTIPASPRCVYPAAAGACPALSSTYNLTSLASVYTAGANKSILAAGSVAAGSSVTYKFTVGIDSGADNSDQGLTAKEPITFTFGQ